MKKILPLFLAGLSLVARGAEVPAQPIATKGAPIFSDDFSAAELAKAWKISFPAFTVAEGVLQASQTKPEHSAVGRVPVGAKDVVIEFKFQLGGATSFNAVCNDPQYKEGHGGHICRVAISPRQIMLGDDKERLRHDIEEMRKDPARREEVKRLTAGREQQVPMTLDPTRWYALTVEILDEEMRVSLDGKPVGYLKSSGIAHPDKREFYFAVSGSGAQFDDVHIWNAQPAKP
jgi:hypothetical protein